MRDLCSLAGRCLKAVRAVNWGSGGAYVVECIEYVNPNPLPEGDPFEDPEELARILSLTRKSILGQAQEKR